MPPKRATGASSTKTDLKRTKDVSQDLAARATKAVRGGNSTTSPHSEDEQDDHDEEKQLTKKKPVPKPRKKTSSTADTGSSAVVRETESSKRSNSGNDNGIASNGIHNGNTKYASTSLVTASQKRQLRMEDMTKEEIAIALEDLQKKYKKLKYLRHTEAESHLDEYKSKLDEMTLSTENYRAQMEPQFNAALRSEILLRDTNEILNAKVRTLQRDLRDARDNLKQVEKDAKTRAKDASLNSVLTNPNLDQDSAMDASTVHLFEDMSGFRFVPRDTNPRSSKDGLPSVWDCEHTGHHGTLRFTLTYSNAGDDEVSYKPDLDPEKDGGLMSIIPNYLQTDIDFKRQFQSKLFRRILALNSDDDI